MITRGWFGPLIGMVVALLLYFLLVPHLGTASGVIGIILLIMVAVCAVLVVLGFARERH